MSAPVPRGQLLLTGLALLAATLACLTPAAGPSAAAPTPTPQTAATAAPATQPPATQKAAPAVTPTEARLVLGPGAFVFPDTTIGLADLASYQATLTLTFDGTLAGAAQHWAKTYVMLAQSEPAARQLTIDKSGDLPELDAVFLAEADGAAYERVGQGDCAASVADPAEGLAARLEPASFLVGVIGADDAGADTVNGVAAEHYTFDERALGLAGLATATGELWVAAEGGYLAQYRLTTTAGPDYFGEGIDGTLTEDYALTNANQPVAIALPADCPAGLVNAPQLPDASNVQNVPGLLTYDTASNLADVVAFYQAQLPPLGWTALGDPIFTDTTALLGFTQADQKLTVIVTLEAGVTSVSLTLGPLT